MSKSPNITIYFMNGDSSIIIPHLTPEVTIDSIKVYAANKLGTFPLEIVILEYPSARQLLESGDAYVPCDSVSVVLNTKMDRNYQFWYDTLVLFTKVWNEEGIRRTLEIMIQPPMTVPDDETTDTIVTIRERCLYDAVMDGNNEMVFLLLSSNFVIDLEYKDILGFTPLSRAVERRRKDLVDLLINADACVNTINVFNERNDAYKDSPLTLAAAREDIPIMQRLLNAQANINHADTYGQTALHTLALTNNIPAVQLLLSYDADPSQHSSKKDSLKKSPLINAIRSRNVDMVAQIIKGRANLEQGDGEMTPLWLAVSKRQSNIVNLLLEAKADFSHENYLPFVNQTPLYPSFRGIDREEGKIIALFKNAMEKKIDQKDKLQYHDLPPNGHKSSYIESVDAQSSYASNVICNQEDNIQQSCTKRKSSSSASDTNVGVSLHHTHPTITKK